ncbi:MAG: transcriptional regulator [Thermodesulfobacteriota bacterium]
MTLRQRILELLQGGWFTLRQLSQQLGLREAEVLAHLEHVARSARSSWPLRVEPARCRQCGFVFHKRTRLSAPSRCPMCRSQRLEPPRFSLQRD